MWEKERLEEIKQGKWKALEVESGEEMEKKPEGSKEVSNQSFLPVVQKNC